MSVQEIRLTLEKMLPQFAAALPRGADAERFVRVLNTAVATNPDLVDVDRRSLYAAAMRLAQMGLLPDNREATIIPFKGVAQSMPMVAGVMKLVRNSGEISTWSVHTVHQADQFEYELGDNERILHRPAMGDRGPVTAAYSIVTMKDGEKSREVMSVQEIEAIRLRSRGGGQKGPWQTDYAEMAKKTVIRRHAKRLPLSTDIDGAIREDDHMTELEPQAAETVAPMAAAPAPAPGRSKRLSAAVAASAPVVAPEPPPAAPEDYPQVFVDRETGEIL